LVLCATAVALNLGCCRAFNCE